MNTEIKTESIFCWSCGKSPENCICGREIVPMVAKKPKDILPACGVMNLNDFNVNNEPWLDPKRKDELILRPCCNCQKFWVCNHLEWVNGICPNCNAKGPFAGYVFKKTEFNKIEEKLDKKIVFKSINNSELFKYIEGDESLKNLKFYLESNTNSKEKS